jgi:hypothetical protein
MRRHIIAHDSQFCVTGCGGVETSLHLFFSCPFFASLWCLIRDWVGTSSADPFHKQDHFVHFIHLTGSTELAALSCNYFGFAVFEWCGKNEIAVSSRERIQLFFIY